MHVTHQPVGVNQKPPLSSLPPPLLPPQPKPLPPPSLVYRIINA